MSFELDSVLAVMTIAFILFPIKQANGYPTPLFFHAMYKLLIQSDKWAGGDGTGNGDATKSMRIFIIAVAGTAVFTIGSLGLLYRGSIGGS